MNITTPKQTRMDNRVYYGEYSLKHWIDLILKQNIILPDYQRHFVWDEKKVKTLIDTFKSKQFVPPVTIGSFNLNGTNQNLILDGQQRLTSVLLAYLGLYPDEATYKEAIQKFADENDDEEEAEEQFDNVLKWTFKKLTSKGKNKQEILEKITLGNYKSTSLTIPPNFFEITFLGFSYLVPFITDEKEQQKYYSSELGENAEPEYLYEQVIKKISGWGNPDNLMFVVGATQASQFTNIRKIIPEHFLLVPGVGFQGGSLSEISKYAKTKDTGLLVNASRAIIYAGNGENFAAEARIIAKQYQKEMETYMI